MVLAISFLTFITVFILVYLVMHTHIVLHDTVRMRLKALGSITTKGGAIDEELSKPFSQRVLTPLSGSMAATLMRFTPQAIRKMVEEKMSQAGGIKGLSTDGFLLLWGSMSLSFPLITAFAAMVMGAAVNKVIGLLLIAFAVATALPLIMLNQKIAVRKKNIQKDLPDVLDILTVSVEAGLGFDGALAKLSEKMKGDLVEEFSRVLQEIRIGVPRREVLHSLGVRCNVPDLSLFTTSLIQADMLGVSISNVLRVQSASMRQKRRQQAEEKAMKAPIKMMLPLVLFIFPTIFVILLGPAVIQIIETFTSR